MTAIDPMIHNHYMRAQGILSDHIVAAASVIPAKRVPELVKSRFLHSVAMASRFYNLMSVASGNSGIKTFPSIEMADEHIKNALAKASTGDLPGAAQNLVLSGGRDLITQTVAADPMADGWDWIPEIEACDYCSGQSGPQEGPFQAHYYCGCIPAPRFLEGRPSWPVVENSRVGTSLSATGRL